MSDRECGECTMCCKVLDVDHTVGTPEWREAAAKRHGEPLPDDMMEMFSKPGGQWCQHADRSVGCTVYPKRPLVCRLFKCLWLMDIGHEEHRPDRSKVILTQEGKSDGPFGIIVCVYESYPGTSANPVVTRLLRPLRLKFPVCIVPSQKMKRRMTIPHGYPAEKIIKLKAEEAMWNRGK